MRREIKEGDIVDLYSSDGGAMNELTVENVPQNTGDLWYFRNKFGGVIAQNPLSLNFDCIMKKAKGEVKK